MLLYDNLTPQETATQMPDRFIRFRWIDTDREEQNTMIDSSTLSFLKKLAKNNDREWFQANKKLYEDAQANMVEFAGKMIGEIAKFDEAVYGLDPRKCVFRIYRDVRFSKDKSPYKINLSLYIAPGGRKPVEPGYYFHVQPSASFIAGGKHSPDSPELLKIRNAIARDCDEFVKVVESKEFRERFGELRGESLKTVPKGFEADDPAIEYLKLKSFTAVTDVADDKFLTSPDFSKHAAETARAIYPLNVFLRKALA